MDGREFSCEKLRYVKYVLSFFLSSFSFRPFSISLWFFSVRQQPKTICLSFHSLGNLCLSQALIGVVSVYHFLGCFFTNLARRRMCCFFWFDEPHSFHYIVDAHHFVEFIWFDDFHIYSRKQSVDNGSPHLFSSRLFFFAPFTWNFVQSFFGDDREWNVRVLACSWTRWWANANSIHVWLCDDSCYRLHCL